MHAKRFFYLSAGILLLVVAYQLGASSVGAQSGGSFTGISVDGNSCNTVAITSTGDVCARNTVPSSAGNGTWAVLCSSTFDRGWQYMGNVLDGPIATEPTTWGKVKDGFRK